MAATTATALAVSASAYFRFFDVIFFVALPFTLVGKRGEGLGSSSPGPPSAFLTQAIAEAETNYNHGQEPTVIDTSEAWPRSILVSMAPS